MKPFKYPSTTKDYEECMDRNRCITNEDRIVALLNQLQEKYPNEPLTKRICADCKVLINQVKFLQEKLFDQHYY
jgi:hypothetical protein